MSQAAKDTQAKPSRPAAWLIPLAIGAGVSVALGVYGKLHTGTGVAVAVAGFSSLLTAKVWTATLSAVFAVVQLVTARLMWTRSPSWAAPVHRWSGRLAFLLALPVIVHCLYTVGFSTYDLRTATHSILGCFFCGAFTVKMLVLPKRNLPGWLLPVVGGLVFTALTGLWLTSSFWFFSTTGVEF
ncbi:DUF6529 family protein [Phytohabitans sp. LJ34]|uniref:DUF6529 family protein n=1 Tax=Phytohabitans sp. LJ34 TaxID=3452217 RepID=UPI003F8B0BC1